MSDKPGNDDAKNLSALQAQMHIPEKNDQETAWSSMFHYDVSDRKALWYALYDKKLDSLSSTNPITYEIDKKYTIIYGAWMLIQLPELKVKSSMSKKYAIAWPHNIAHNIIKSGEFKVGDGISNKINNILLDIDMQYFELEGHGHRDFRQGNIGNIPQLETFKEMLPPYPLKVVLPFCFSKDSGYSFPLHRVNYEAVNFKFEFILNVANLIQIKDLETGKLLEFPAADSPKANEIFMTVFDKSVALELPEIYSEYSYMRPEDISCYGDEYIFYDKYLHFTKECEYGQSAEVTINSGGLPVKTLFWVAENMISSKNHIFSNYTGDNNQICPYSPISNIIFKTGDNEDNSIKMPLDYYERMTAKYFPSAPFEPGFFAKPLCVSILNADKQPGKVFTDKNKIIFTLDRKDIYGEPLNCSKFKIHVFALATDKYTFSKTEKTSGSK